VVALGGGGFAATVGAGEGASHGLRQAGAEAASCATELDGDYPHRVLILLTDGLAGDQQEIVRGAYTAVGAGLPLVGDALGGERPQGLIAFDCIARRRVLGERIGAEIDRITAHGDGAPVAGFYTYGAIARTHGTSGFHNQTLVVLAVG
jgi:hypothetical protein